MNRLWLKISIFFATTAISLILVETRLTSLDEAKVLGIPSISCSTKWISLSFEASIPFQGRIFVEDMAYDSRCSAQYTSNLEQNATFRFPMRPCARMKNGKDKNSYVFIANVRINFHPIFILENSKTYRITCTDTNKEALIEEDGNANTLCHHNIMRPKNDLSSDLTIGKTIYHKWTCSKGFEFDKFAILLRKCDVISKTREIVHVIDENGCIIDDLLLNSLKYSKDKLEITAETKIFKFIDESELRFICNIVLVPKEKPETIIKFPKCSISRAELRLRAAQKASPTFYFDQTDQLYRDFSTIMKDEKENLKETRTITEWLTIKEAPMEPKMFKESVVVGKINRTINNEMIYKEKLMEQDILKKFMPNQLPLNKTKSEAAMTIKQTYNSQMGSLGAAKNSNSMELIGRQAIAFDKMEDFQDLTPTTMITNNKNESTTKSLFPSPPTKPLVNLEDLIEIEKIAKVLSEISVEKENDEEDSKEESIKGFSNSLEIVINDSNNPPPKSSELQASSVQEKDELPVGAKADWRLDDVILNKTDDDEIFVNCANSEFSKSNQSNLTIYPETLTCTWKSLNVALLLWSLGTLIIWTILIGIKAHQLIWSKDSKKRNDRYPINARTQNMQATYYHPTSFHGRYGSTFYPNSLIP